MLIFSYDSMNLYNSVLLMTAKLYGAFRGINTPKSGKQELSWKIRILFIMMSPHMK